MASILSSNPPASSIAHRALLIDKLAENVACAMKKSISLLRPSGHGATAARAARLGLVAVPREG
jgi:hypothetical protein